MWEVIASHIFSQFGFSKEILDCKTNKQIVPEFLENWNLICTPTETNGKMPFKDGHKHHAW